MSDNKNNEDKYFLPTEAVSKAAAKGLELHDKFNKGGTEVGVARAKQLKDKEKVDVEDIKSISSYFARHEVDKKAEDFGNDANPSKGYIAWLLWGGDAGQKWAQGIKDKIESEK
ncbi:MAG: hypothetical protein EOP33_00995 [Rickettsiaceae bacterium]|nr:MAG: hypothetical protein EOP33_00995 [Rickettsiaceae bacterium]